MFDAFREKICGSFGVSGGAFVGGGMLCDWLRDCLVERRVNVE